MSTKSQNLKAEAPNDFGSQGSSELNAKSVSFALLGWIALAFLLGVAGCGIVTNFLKDESITFSTISIIGFVLSVGLSGASIVLAISAIMLGKFSEQAMITRSDESIRLQNEVFQKTTDALQRIESSTGVTEKRLEDIISGRVGDLSEKIASSIASDDSESKGQITSEDVEEMIRQTLFSELRPDRTFGLSHPAGISEEEKNRRADREKRLSEERKIYQNHHTELLRAFSLRKDLTALKMDHGQPNGSGEEIFDGIFQTETGDRIGVSTFASSFAVENVEAFCQNSLEELRNETVSEVFIVLFEEDKEKRKTFEKITRIADPNLAKKLQLVVCGGDLIQSTVKELKLFSSEGSSQ